MPACKVCGHWFVKIKPQKELCDKCESALYRLSGYVAPVVHGRWVLDEYARYFRCSACGTQFDDETDTYCNIMNGFAPNYCEECGAKMDGGAE